LGAHEMCRARERKARAASPLFISSCTLINMQTGNVRDLLLVKCQPMSAQKKVGLNIDKQRNISSVADRKELKTVKSGRPNKENNCANDVCRVCEISLWLKYGSRTAKSSVNLSSCLKERTHLAFCGLNVLGM